MTRARRARADEDGFTLIELVITVAILGIVVVAMTGMVMSYAKTNKKTSARLTASNDVQFATAYWQRDVASIGVRSDTYDNSPTVHSFPLLQSVAANGNTGLTPGCALPAGSTTIVTLGWSEYKTSSPTETPTKVTVAYVTQAAGNRTSLIRVRCNGSTGVSTITVARNLDAAPTVTCNTSCNSATVPTTVSLALSSKAPDAPSTDPSYTATLVGERRET